MPGALRSKPSGAVRSLAATLALALVACAMAGRIAEAGWLSRLLSGPQGAQAGEASAASSGAAFDAAARFIRSLPEAERGPALAVAATHEGHWRLANAAGEQFTAASPEELTHAFANLLAKSVGVPALYIGEHTAFALRGRLRELPKGAKLAVVVASKAFPVHAVSSAGRERHFAMAGSRLAVELIERPVFDEILWQLSRPLRDARVRQVAFEPGGPAALTPSPRIDPQSGKADIDRITPGALASELAAIRGQTALVSARIEGDRIAYQPARGAEGSISMRELLAAAAASDAGLLILDSNSPRQPVGRNWLWLRVELKGLETALGLATMGDFLSSLAASGETLAVSGALEGDHVRLTARPLAAVEAGAGRGGLLSELATRVTGNVAATGIEALLLSASRRGELELRLVPWIASDWQYGYLALLVAGLLGAGASWCWWSALWPAERREDYAGRMGFIAARLMRAIAYVLLFMPFAALPGIGARLLALLRRAPGSGQRQPVR